MAGGPAGRAPAPRVHPLAEGADCMRAPTRLGGAALLKLCVTLHGRRVAHGGTFAIVRLPLLLARLADLGVARGDALLGLLPRLLAARRGLPRPVVVLSHAYRPHSSQRV